MRYCDVAVLAPIDHAGLREHTEVLGHVLLRGGERFGQLLDARLALAQAVQQADRVSSASTQARCAIG